MPKSEGKNLALKADPKKYQFISYAVIIPGMYESYIP